MTGYKRKSGGNTIMGISLLVKWRGKRYKNSYSRKNRRRTIMRVSLPVRRQWIRKTSYSLPLQLGLTLS